MEDIYNVDDLNQKVERPQFLKVLCILSFISLGLTYLGNISQITNGKSNEEQMLKNKVEIMKSVNQLEQIDATYWAEEVRKMIPMEESLNNNVIGVALLSIFIASLGLFGVLKMWNGYKIGFHFYIIYSLLGISQLYFFCSPSYIPSIIPIWNLILSGIFVFMYSKNLNWMK